MIEFVAPFFAIGSGSAKALAWVNDIRMKTKGDVRALSEELKENLRLCIRVVEDNVQPDLIIPKFSTEVFDRLNVGGFDFNSAKRCQIPEFNGITNSDLSSWIGKKTSELIGNIYDKVKDLRSLHAFNAKGASLWRRRIINIYKRLQLLIRHMSHLMVA